MKKIGIITSGGDAPGMNACVKSIVDMAHNLGFMTFAFRRGFNGLINDDWIELMPEDVQLIFNLGGSAIFSGRCKPFLELEHRKTAASNVKNLGLDCVIVIGGNGSYNGALELSKLDVNVITIPATIDNDVYSTERAIGFDSAVNNAVNIIDNIHQTMYANDRISLIEVMGRLGGNIALYSAMASESEIVVVPEDKKMSKEQIKQLIRAQLEIGNLSPTVVIAEKQLDINEFCEEIKKELNHDCRATVLGYLQRGGSPTVYDRMLAVRTAVRAVQLIEEGKYNVALGIQNDLIQITPLEDAVEMKSNFREDLYRLFKDLNNYSIRKK